MNGDDLQRRIELAREKPELAVMLLTVPAGHGPTCELCGGRQAPIIDGRHLAPEKFCEVQS